VCVRERERENHERYILEGEIGVEIENLGKFLNNGAVEAEVEGSGVLGHRSWFSLDIANLPLDR
jgi:hypothetical protein